jgi:hypothetical protein
MTAESRPFSAVAWAMLHRIADGDADALTRLAGYFLDPSDEAGERWQFLRVADTNAWKSVELLLLRQMIERRFAEGELDAWVETTPLGQEIRDGMDSFFECFGSLEFSSEPKSFGTLVFQELRAARLAGELNADLHEPGNSAEEIMERLAARLEERFPLFARAVRTPGLDIGGIAWVILDWFLRRNFETLVALPTTRTPPPNVGLEDMAVLFMNCPSRVDELLGDVYADGEFTRRVRFAETRKGVREKGDDDLRQQAEAEVAAILGRAVPIQATTLADALAQAEQIKTTENILVAQNSLWEWYNALPLAEREEIGRFENKRRFWIAVRFRHRSQ